MSSTSEQPAVLDVRPAGEFIRRHRPGSVNIPLEELTGRIHELSPRDQPLIVFDAVPVRARWACSRLRARGRTNLQCVHGDAWLDRGPVVSGPSVSRLWRPHDLLVEGLRLARERWGILAGRVALDLACGTGRDAVYMALEGLTAHACDILPDAVERAADLARRSGVALATSVRDLESDPQLPPDAFDLISCFRFLHRPLLSHIARALRPGGIVIYETFLLEHRERYGKPRRDAHLLRPGELRDAFAGFDVLAYREGEPGHKQIVASLIAARPL